MLAVSLLQLWRVAASRFAPTVVFTFLFALASSEQGKAAPDLVAVTNIAQAVVLASENPTKAYAIRLEANVWWVNPSEGRLVLQDASGAEEFELDLHNTSVRAATRVRIEGSGTITRTGFGFKLGARGPVVDNNGVHSVVEKSGAVFLPAGHQPLRVDWFNGVEKFALEVEYEGPGVPRQRIPDAALFRGATNLMNGLEYRCYEGNWEWVPDFSRLTPVSTGDVTNFDLGVAPQLEHVGIRFTGSLLIPQDGLYTFYVRSDDGCQLSVGEPILTVTDLGAAPLPQPRRIVPGEVVLEEQDCLWSSVEGTTMFVSERTNALELELSSGTGRMRVELPAPLGLSSNALLNRRIQATGVCRITRAADGQRVAGALLVPSEHYVEIISTPASHETGVSAHELPLLTTAVEVHRLKREEAERRYPVRLRGVITCVLPDHLAFTIQDSTRALYVEDFSMSRSSLPRIGEFLEVEGTTDAGKFAPVVNARRVRNLGAGYLPEPVHPTWDQLLNGSLDAQYVELQGIVTAVDTNGLTLLTRDGRIRLELRMTGMQTESLDRFEDALVRVRGCLLATWDYVTHQVTVGGIRIYGAEVSTDDPPAADLFSIPKKTTAELLLFDPQAGLFQRVKVSGQVVHVDGAVGYLVDGKNGLRFVMKKEISLETGDIVEVVGFPELSGASPILREAVARKISHAPLPEPTQLLATNVLRVDVDATRVRLEGVLTGVRETAAEEVLEIQSGVRTFAARLAGREGKLQSLPIGSRLELTGVYAAQGGKLAGQAITSFELLLNAVDDVKVLARPPWWTLERLLIVVGALAFVLAITVLWITQLHRQVEVRTTELELQIQQRQRAEHQRALEQERARIAQDLHDELGSGLTEISMLGARARSANAPEPKRSRHLEQIGDKSRDLIMTLDEIVWAMNPRHDTLASLISYFCLYADRFLGLANIAWKLEDSSEPPEQAVNSQHRHQLFLAFKEALTNIVRHSGASEVRLGVKLEDGYVHLSVADNGRGLPSSMPSDEMDGVRNMRERLGKLGGRFEIVSERGRGTVLQFYVPAR